MINKVLLAVLLILSFVLARPDSDSNVVDYARIRTKFNQDQKAIDGDKSSFLVLPEGQQKVIELEFKPIFYFRQLRIYFKPGKVPQKMTLEKKIERTAQYQLLQEIDIRGSLQDGLFLVSIELDNVAARQLRLVFPESLTAELAIAEIELFPNMSIWPVGELVAPTLITDQEVFLSFKSDQEMQTVFELSSGEETKKIASVSSGKQHDIWIHGLKPDTKYSVRVNMFNYLGNMNNSDQVSFLTHKNNLVLKKPVNGTFNHFQPDDKFVARDVASPISLINDGDDSYFTSMATSGDPSKAEQYFKIDLEEIKSAKQLVIVWRALAYSKSYRVEISKDNQSWESVATAQDAGGGSFSYSRTGDPVRIMQHQLNNKKFRYLKVIIPYKSPYYVADPKWRFVQIMEVKLF